jgi:hypothetical protein
MLPKLVTKNRIDKVVKLVGLENRIHELVIIIIYATSSMKKYFIDETI